MSVDERSKASRFTSDTLSAQPFAQVKLGCVIGVVALELQHAEASDELPTLSLEVERVGLKVHSEKKAEEAFNLDLRIDQRLGGGGSGGDENHYMRQTTFEVTVNDLFIGELDENTMPLVARDPLGPIWQPDSKKVRLDAMSARKRVRRASNAGLTDTSTGDSSAPDVGALMDLLRFDEQKSSDKLLDLRATTVVHSHEPMQNPIMFDLLVHTVPLKIFADLESIGRISKLVGGAMPQGPPKAPKSAEEIELEQLSKEGEKLKKQTARIEKLDKVKRAAYRCTCNSISISFI